MKKQKPQQQISLMRSLPFESGRGRTKATSEQIIAAYRETGSVWSTAKRLGMCGQSVWERLRALDYPIRSRDWTEEEITELRQLAGQCTIGEISYRLGRPYAGVACKMSELGLAATYGKLGRRKASRVKYAKAKVLKLIDILERYDGSVRQFAREQSLDLELFIQAIQRHDKPFWDNYTRRRSDLTAKVCPHCGDTYYPLTKKQTTCSRRCTTQVRNNRDYFGGKRQQTIGLAEGVCQLCMELKAALSAHHLIGKENDADNEFLVALDRGCHQLVGLLAGRRFVDTEQGWENLINLVLSRRLADKNRKDQTDYVAVHTAVSIEWLTRDDMMSLHNLDEDDANQLVAPGRTVA